MMLDEMMHMMGRPGDPVGILMAASIVKDDAPWLYELAMEVYRAVKSGDPSSIKAEMERLHRFSDFTMGAPYMEVFDTGDRDTHMLCMEFPRMLEHLLDMSLHEEPVRGRHRVKKASEPS